VFFFFFFASWLCSSYSFLHLGCVVVEPFKWGMMRALTGWALRMIGFGGFAMNCSLTYQYLL
jgi:hypothetical protein